MKLQMMMMVNEYQSRELQYDSFFYIMSSIDEITNLKIEPLDDRQIEAPRPPEPKNGKKKKKVN